MNFAAEHFSSPWLYLGWGLMLLALLKSAVRIRWTSQTQPELTAWFGATVVVLLLWQMRAQILPGLAFHLVGATALTLITGTDRARFAMLLVLIGDTLQGHAEWSALGLSWVVAAGLPTWLTMKLLGWAQLRLPANFFVYIFANAFGAGALSMWSIGLAQCVLLALSGAYPVAFLLEEQLPYYLLMGWPEAFTTGFYLTMLVIYRPQWVSTFDDTRYLNSR
ncbi:energy-coupling factor ABC transporter permease [Chitinibacteraceae bacterium HSL-7]